MNISKKWLNEYIDIASTSDDALKAILNQHITEIETMEPLVDSSPLVIGHVESLIKHPDADKLSVCQVNVGDHTEQIICGAANVQAGQRVIVALPGASLPGDFHIKKTKIRGIESNGMICSLKELGLEDKYIETQDRDGIYVLDASAPIGGSALDFLDLDDTVYTLGLTPNRGDLLSIYGLALDLSSAIRKPIKPLQVSLKESNVLNPIKVEVNTPLTYRYTARTIENVTVSPSPWWLRAKLIASNIRPINNVVDITNYVLLLLGQPLHAFDKNKLGCENILVRQAKNNEKVIALDEEEYTLDETDVVITSNDTIVAIGGVMGGLHSSVDNFTTSIVLESAHFDPRAIRNTSSKLGLRSDSSLRFERGVDPSRLVLALEYATKLIVELAGGTVLKGMEDVVMTSIDPVVIELSKARVESTLGTEIPNLGEMLQALHYQVTDLGHAFKLGIPTHRLDILRQQDVIEEIARMQGYDAIIASVAKISASGGLSREQKLRRHTRHFFANKGLHEIITYSLTSQSKLFEFVEKNEEAVALSMPMSEERAWMRQSLLTGLVDVIEYNHSRQLEDVAIFELGRTYTTKGETEQLSIGLSGSLYSSQWQGNKGIVDFYTLKGVVDAYLSSLGVSARYEALSTHHAMHPGKSATLLVNGKSIGMLGQLHPLVEQKRGLSCNYVAQINLDALFNEIPHALRFEALSKQPSIQRDLALVVDDKVTADQVIDYMRQTGKKALIDVNVFDVYQGANMEANKKSMAFSLTFQDPHKTLESSEVDALIDRILKRLEREINATLR